MNSDSPWEVRVFLAITLLNSIYSHQVFVLDIFVYINLAGVVKYDIIPKYFIRYFSFTVSYK